MKLGARIRRRLGKVGLWLARRTGVLPRGVDVYHDLRRALPDYRPRIVLDVGAHHGESLLGILAWAPRARVYCFEPASNSFERLAQVTRRWRNVTCERIALGRSPGHGVLVRGRTSDTDRLVPTGLDQSNSARVEPVSIDTVDRVCVRYAIHHIGFLKIDTEGFDLDVLHGAEDVLRTAGADLVQVETGMNPDNALHVPLHRFQEYLEPLGYRLFGLYEQVHEWPTKSVHLRRVNGMFVSSRLIASAPVGGTIRPR